MIECEPEILGTDHIPWEVGPLHAILPGPFVLRLVLDGEIVVSSQIENGFTYRGLERAMESQPWGAQSVYADRLDPENAIFCEMVVCQAVEQILGLTIPVRAKVVRTLLSEMNRISSHLLYMSKMARATGCETAMHFLLRDRERFLDLFELITGSRSSFNYVRIGGISNDVTDGFVERLVQCCDMVLGRVKEYNHLLTFNHAFLKRTAYVGIIYPHQVHNFGITGPNARASGVAFDLRKDRPYASYAELEFSVPLGKGEFGAPGDCYDRFLIRVREIEESVHLIKQASESLPTGKFFLPPIEGAEIPAGEAISRVETPRGMLICHVISEGGVRPARVHFSTPSQGHLSVLPDVLNGARVGDLAPVLASFDLSLSEADR